MISVRLQGLTTCLLASLVCSVGQSAAAQSSAGESANFAALMGEVDADLTMIEPACTNCGTMVVEEASKGGADATPAVASMEDETTLEFSADRPDSVSGGPDPVVTPIDDEMDGLDFELTTEDEQNKASPLKLKRKTKLKLKVKPEKRAKFPTMDAADACDPAKAFKKTQLGWRTVRIASVAKKKTGKTLVSKARTVKVCVRTPPAEPKTCALSCGAGSCQQKYASSKWTPTCLCKPGYAFDGKTCNDIDECSVKGGVKCPSDRQCINTPGAFECGCPTDMIASATGCRKKTACDSITCKTGQVCKLASVGASCGCTNANEVLVAGVCKPINVCSASSCGISPGVACKDASKDKSVPAGEFVCDCPDGAVYQGAGKLGRCVDINECAIPSLLSYCGKLNPCRNVDTVGSVSLPYGATCGPERLPPAPAANATFNAKTRKWQ